MQLQSMENYPPNRMDFYNFLVPPKRFYPQGLNIVDHDHLTHQIIFKSKFFLIHSSYLQIPTQ